MLQTTVGLKCLELPKLALLLCYTVLRVNTVHPCHCCGSSPWMHVFWVYKYRKYIWVSFSNLNNRFIEAWNERLHIMHSGSFLAFVLTVHVFESMRKQINTEVKSRRETFVDVQHRLLHFYSVYTWVLLPSLRTPPQFSSLPQVSHQGNEYIHFLWLKYLKS